MKQLLLQQAMFCTSQHAKIREAILVPKHWKFCCMLLNTTLQDFVWYEITQNLAALHQAPWLTAEYMHRQIFLTMATVLPVHSWNAEIHGSHCQR